MITSKMFNMIIFENNTDSCAYKKSAFDGADLSRNLIYIHVRTECGRLTFTRNCETSELAREVFNKLIDDLSGPLLSNVRVKYNSQKFANN
jgi:hypothetical protein